MSGSVTLFLESLHNVPAEGWTAAAYSVVRAGKVAAAPDYRVERAAHPGQDVLFCIAGAGFIETLGQRLEVRPGQLVWIANEEPHRHAAEPRDPWTVLWFRLDGPNPPALRQMLFGAEAPRIHFADGASPLLWFERLFATLRSRNFGLDLHLNQLVSEFLSIVDRHVVGTTSDLPQPLARVVQAMRDNLRLAWNAEALTEITGLGASADPPSVPPPSAHQPAAVADPRTAARGAESADAGDGARFGGRRALRVLRRLPF